MLFRRFTCFLLSMVLSFQSIAPTLAMQSLEDLEQREGLPTYSSIPTSLSFKVQPGRTAAGTFLYAFHEEKVFFLLGQRSESKQWCNPGGGSEADNGKEVFLFHTAVRETDEELNRFYCPHVRILKNQPFIDTYNGSLFYRMYWHQVQYLDEKILIKSLQGATAVGQEFSNFIWLEASDLLQAVVKQQPVIQANPEKKIELYPELFTTLSTSSGVAFLTSLANYQSLKRFSKDVRPLVNRLYFVGPEAPTSMDLKPMPAVLWPQITLDSEGVAAAAQDLAIKNMYRSALSICPATSEGKLEYEAKRKAFIEKKDSLAEVVFPPNEYEVVDLNKEGDKSIFAGAVAAHLGSIIGLKRLFSKNKEVATQNTAPQDVANLEDSYSDMSLRIILGPDYKTSQHFPGAENPQDAADDKNIEIYLDRYYGTGELGDGKRDVKVLPSDHTLLKSFLQWGRHKAWPIFWNATSDNNYSLTLDFTHLREYTMATPLEGSPGFRGTDIYFKGIKVMSDAIERYGYRDYTPGEPNGRSNLILCANATVLAGLNTTRTSSSSFEYVMNNHSVRPPDLGSVFQEALALAGFDAPTNKYFHALFQQFIAHNHPEYANSVMFAIQLHPELLETYSYPAFGGGDPYTKKDEYIVQCLPKNPTPDLFNGLVSKGIALYTKDAGLFCKVLDQEEMEIPQDGIDIALDIFGRLKEAAENNIPLQPKDKKALLDYTRSRNYTEPEEKFFTTSQIFEGLRAEYEKQKEFPEPFEQDKERKKALISEIRILPHPEVAFDPEKFLVTPFPRFPIPNKPLYTQQMNLVSMAMIADWLENENCILEGSFHQYPVAKNLYNRVHLGVTGSPVKENLSFEGLFYLVQHGHVEAVKGYIETYPEVLTDAPSVRLILAALKSNVPDILQLVLIDLKDRLQIKVSEEEMTKLLRIAKDFKWNRSAAFILTHMQQKQLNFSKASLPVLYQLLQPELEFGFLSSTDLEKRIQLLPLCTASFDKPGWFKSLILDHLFTTSLFQVINKVCLEFFFPENVLSPCDVIFKAHEELCSSPTWGSMANFGLPYQKLFTNFLTQYDDQDLLFQQGRSGNPFIFDLIEWGNPLCKDFLTYLKTKSALFTIKNNEGLGLLAAFQKAHLEGYPAKPLTSLITLYKGAGLDIEKESYPPFFQLYGLHYKEDVLYANHTSLLNQSKNRQWALQLAGLMPPQDLSELLKACPDGRLWEKFSYKLNSFELSKVIQARTDFHSAFDWVRKLKKILNSMQQNKEGRELEQKRYNPFGWINGMGDLLDNHMKGCLNYAKAIFDARDGQFPDIYSSPYRDVEEPQSLSEVLTHIPESISSIEDILEKLEEDFFHQGLNVYFQSLPEFDKVSALLMERKEGLAAKRAEWLNQLQALVETRNVTEIYQHVANMPFLPSLQYCEVEKLLYPYMSSTEIFGGLFSYGKNYQEEAWLKKAEMIPNLIQENRVVLENIEEFILTSPSAAALRESLHIFLKKNMAPYLPMVLSGAYGCAADFAKENLFYQKLNDNVYIFPGTYHHPFPYALMGGEDPVLMVQNLLPYLDEQNAPDLLKRFDKEYFWKLITTNNPKDLEVLVKLIPWMFQWHKKEKDFFLLSIQHLPKLALSHLIMASLDILKVTEMSRCLPYFVHLMMDGGNEAIVKQALTQAPSLLGIQTLDGLGIDDFLTFYASPPIVRVIHAFQKKK